MVKHQRSILQELSSYGFPTNKKSIDKLKIEFKRLKEGSTTFESLKVIFTIAKANNTALQNFVFLLKQLITNETIKVQEEEDKVCMFALNACTMTFEKANSPC